MRSPKQADTNLERRRRYEVMRVQMELERSTFISHWSEIGQHVSPRRVRLYPQDTNRGDKRNAKIVDSKATKAARTMRSGMMSGMTSPAREWKRLTTEDPTLSQFARVKDFLHLANERMSALFLKSNLYNVLPTVYGDIGTFGTSAMLIEEDFKRTARFECFPLGTFCIGTDPHGRVNQFSRTFMMTVSQIVDKFGRTDEDTGQVDWSNISEHVKNLYEQSHYSKWVYVTHVICPNDDYNPMKFHQKFKRYASVYYERGLASGTTAGYSTTDNQPFLRESGYDYFPVLAPRWEVASGDVYGTDCPGMTALGDIKELQLLKKRKAQAVEKLVNPPLAAPTSLRNSGISTIPGGTTWVDDPTGKSFRAAYQIDPPIEAMNKDIVDIRQSIDECFYADLFRLLIDSDRRQITAREVEERHEEKLIELGPVLQQVDTDLLNPLIETTFYIMMKQGHLPPLPPELRGQALKVEYISIMAQAQKLLNLGGMERLSGMVQQIGSFYPDAFDTINFDNFIEEYADSVGVAPRLIHSPEERQGIRQNRAQQQQAQAKAQAMQQGADTAKNLSQTDTTKDNALTQLMEAAKAGSLVGVA